MATSAPCVLRSLAATLLALAALAACGEPPRPVVADGHEGHAHTLEGKPHPSEPATRPAPATSPVARFGGRVHLRGELADASEGAVFVSVVPRAGGQPILAKRFLLGGADVVRLADETVVTFALDERDNMLGKPMEREVDLKVSYRPGGFVESPEAARAILPVEPGDVAIDVFLPQS
jgi:hypothetical protein